MDERFLAICFYLFAVLMLHARHRRLQTQLAEAHHRQALTITDIIRLKLVYGGVLALLMLMAYRMVSAGSVFLTGLAVCAAGLALFYGVSVHYGRMVGAVGVIMLISICASVTAMAQDVVVIAVSALAQVCGLCWLQHWAINHPVHVRSTPVW